MNEFYKTDRVQRRGCPLRIADKWVITHYLAPRVDDRTPHCGLIGIHQRIRGCGQVGEHQLSRPGDAGTPHCGQVGTDQRIRGCGQLGAHPPFDTAAWVWGVGISKSTRR